MPKYRKKPREVKAIQLTEKTKLSDIEDIFKKEPADISETENGGLSILSRWGTMELGLGDYLVVEPNGWVHAGDQNTFERLYEKVTSL